MPGTPGMPGMPGAPMRYPEESQAVVSLVLSLIGIVACGGVLCPVGWWYGNKEIKAIDAGLRDPTKRDLAMAGKIIGIVGTLLVAVTIIAFVGIFIVAALSAAASA